MLTAACKPWRIFPVNTQTRIVASSAAARFTTTEFLRMVEVGAFDDMKVELVDGELERMPPPMSAHARRQAMVTALLWQVVAAKGLLVVGEVGVDLGGDSVLACDVALIRALPAESRMLRPNEVLLLVEVAETTVARDLGMKRVKYASAGIANYWVVDGGRAVVHVHHDPIDGEYAGVSTVRFGVPLMVPDTDATIIVE